MHALDFAFYDTYPEEAMQPHAPSKFATVYYMNNCPYNLWNELSKGASLDVGSSGVARALKIPAKAH